MTRDWQRRRERAGVNRCGKRLRPRLEGLEERALLALAGSPLDYVADEVLVQYRPGVVPAALGWAGGEALDVLERIETGVMRAQGVGPLDRLKLPAGLSVEAAIAALGSHPLVAHVQPNYVYETAAVPTDTYYANGSLWGMRGDDAGVSPAIAPNAFGTGAEEAWDAGNLGSQSVVVGVIDTGIQFGHSDLDANMWLNPYEIAGNGVDDDGNGYVDDMRGWDFYNNDATVYHGTSGDPDNHGTHVAGTIGAEANGVGVVGVNQLVTMISVKFLGGASGSGTTANAIKAVDYLTDLKTRHGVNIVATNNSWGGGGYDQGLLDAINRGYAQGILFVAAAGNNGTSSANYPAAYNSAGIISVASITSSGALSSFSNYNATTVDLGAPGSGIWSTVPNGTYASYSGTSMATPHVTGAAALYASVNARNTGETLQAYAARIKSAILGSVTATPSLAGKTVTGGRLDIGNLMSATPPPPAAGITVSPTSGLVTAEGGMTASFTIVLNSAPTANVTIPISSNDTTEGTVAVNSLTFTPTNWSQAQTVVVTGVDDTEVDGDVSYLVVTGDATSTDAAYQGLNAADVAVTNRDNDTAQPSMTINNVAATEGNAGQQKTFTFTVTLSATSTTAVTVNFSTANGTAVAGSDYVARTGTLTINAGATTGTIDVTVNGDTSREKNETFFVNLSGAVGATITDSQGQGTIQNDDGGGKGGGGNSVSGGAVDGVIDLLWFVPTDEDELVLPLPGRGKSGMRLRG